MVCLDCTGPVRLRLLPGIDEWEEPVLVEALGLQPAVEGLDESVVCRLLRSTEFQADAVEISLLIQTPARELAAAIHADLLWHSTPLSLDAVEHMTDIVAA